MFVIIINLIIIITRNDDVFRQILCTCSCGQAVVPDPFPAVRGARLVAGSRRHGGSWWCLSEHAKFSQRSSLPSRINANKTFVLGYGETEDVGQKWTEHSVHPSIRPKSNPSINRLRNPLIYSRNKPTHPSIHPSIHPFIHQPTLSPTRPSIHQSTRLLQEDVRTGRIRLELSLLSPNRFIQPSPRLIRIVCRDAKRDGGQITDTTLLRIKTYKRWKYMKAFYLDKTKPFLSCENKNVHISASRVFWFCFLER